MTSTRRDWLPQAVALLNTGLTCSEVARVVGKAHMTVWRALRQSGVETRSPAATAELLRQRRLEEHNAAWGAHAEALYRRGTALREIAVEVSATPERVKEILRHRGMTVRTLKAACQASAHTGQHLVGRGKSSDELDPYTVVVYERRYRAFARWCAKNGFDPAPQGPDAAEQIQIAVETYAVERLAAGYAPRGITAILGGIRHYLAREGLVVPGALSRLKAVAAAVRPPDLDPETGEAA